MVTDNNTGRCFLVDTGAQVSAVPSLWLDRRFGPSDQHLHAANGRSYGTRNLLLHLGNHRYSAGLVIADVKRLLLGADLLRQHNLLVDARGQRLIEADTYLSVSCDVTLTSVSQLAPIEIGSNKYRKVLNDFSELSNQLSLILQLVVVSNIISQQLFMQEPVVYHMKELTIAKNKFAEM